MNDTLRGFVACLLIALCSSVAQAQGGAAQGHDFKVGGFWHFYIRFDGAIAEEGPEHITIEQVGSVITSTPTCNPSFPSATGSVNRKLVSLLFETDGGDLAQAEGEVRGHRMSGTFVFLATGARGTWRADRTKAVSCEAGMLRKLPFEYVALEDALLVTTPEGPVYVSVGSFGAHFNPLTGHAYGDLKANFAGFFTRSNADLAELPGVDGNEDGICDEGERCGFWGGVAGERIRGRIPVYTAPFDGTVVKVALKALPNPNYFDTPPQWLITVRAIDGFSLTLDHIGRIAGPLRRKIRQATGIDPDVYAGPEGDLPLGSSIPVAAGDELGQPQVFATEVVPGYFVGGGTFPDRPWAQMEFNVSDPIEDDNVCIFELLDPDTRVRLQAVMDTDMVNPASQRYGGPQAPARWKWGAEGRLCRAYSRHPRDFSSIHTAFGGWIERPGPLTTADELFAIVEIIKGTAAYDERLYSSPGIDYLVTRIRKSGTGPFSWQMPDGTLIDPGYPAGEILALGPDSMLIKWRDIPWGSGVVYQRAAFVLTGEGLKIKWGNFAGGPADATLPGLAPFEPCNDVAVICYDHELRPGF